MEDHWVLFEGEVLPVDLDLMEQYLHNDISPGCSARSATRP